MSTANEKILSRLKKHEEPPRKPLSIPFKVDNIKNLDALAKAMTQYSGQTTTRNMLIEDAVESFIQDATVILNEEGIDLNIESDEDFDTVVFPAQMGEDYEQAFFNDREWRYVRIAKARIPKIKYIALYVGTPQSAICHYAVVDHFEYEESEKKYRIVFDGEPRELEHPVPLGSASPLAVRSPKYTTLQKLLAANEFREL